MFYLSPCYKFGTVGKVLPSCRQNVPKTKLLGKQDGFSNPMFGTQVGTTATAVDGPPGVPCLVSMENRGLLMTILIG